MNIINSKRALKVIVPVSLPLSEEAAEVEEVKQPA